MSLVFLEFQPLPTPHSLYTIMKLFCLESSDVKTNHISNQLFSLNPEGNCSPLQYSCLENLMDRGAWRVHGITKSQTWFMTEQKPTVGFSRQEYSSGSPFPLPGDFPEPEIKHGSPTLQADSLPSELPGKPLPLYVLEYIWPLSRKINYSIIEKILYNGNLMQSFRSLLSICI